MSPSKQRNNGKAPRSFDLDNLLHKDSNAVCQDTTITPSTGIYAIYKHATKSFRDGLAKLLPNKFRLRSLDDYKRGADWILQQTTALADAYERRKQQEASATAGASAIEGTLQKRQIDRSILKNLDVSIRLRQEQARKHGDSDEGHNYIISVLKYCRDALSFSRSTLQMLSLYTTTQIDGRTNARSTIGRGNQSLSFPQGVWELCNGPPDASQECEAEQEPTPPAIPSPPLHSPSNSVPCPGTDDLVNADDRFQCIAFLSTMDRLVEDIRNRFDEVKKVCIEDIDDDQILHPLMEAAIATNVSMQCIQSTWAELTLEHPHIRNLYDLLALVFVLPSLQKQRYRNLFSHTNVQYPHLVLHFVGDVVEACFAVEGLDTGKAVQNYGSRLRLPNGNWEKELLLMEAKQLADEACSIVLERRTDKIRTNFLRRYKFIGGSRCILNTQKVLQQVFVFLKHQSKVNGKNAHKMTESLAKAAENSFPSASQEDQNFPCRSLSDLDRMLASEILPELIKACTSGGQYSVHECPCGKRLVPLLLSLHSYLKKDTGGPVPVDITFGFHCMMIGITSLQGNRHMEEVGTRAKNAFENHLTKSGQSWSLFLGERKKKARNHFEIMKGVGNPTWLAPLSQTARFNAYWNPLMAGSYCLYTAYTTLMCGAWCIRTRMRHVLHVYNALRCRKLIDPIDILELLDSIFSEAQGIWTTGVRGTKQGEFLKTFLLGLGLTARDVVVIRDYHRSINGIRLECRGYNNDKNQNVAFNQYLEAELESYHFSSGVSVLVHRDYSDLDHETTECGTLVGNASASLKADMKLFGGSFIDWVGVGHLLDMFDDRIFDEMIQNDEGIWSYCMDVLGD